MFLDILIKKNKSTNQFEREFGLLAKWQGAWLRIKRLQVRSLRRSFWFFELFWNFLGVGYFELVWTAGGIFVHCRFHRPSTTFVFVCNFQRVLLKLFDNRVTVLAQLGRLRWAGLSAQFLRNGGETVCCLGVCKLRSISRCCRIDWIIYFSMRLKDLNRLFGYEDSKWRVYVWRGYRTSA
jgi:hypothetical protein